MSSAFCPMIHSGLNINLKAMSGTLGYKQCCLSDTPLESCKSTIDWNGKFFQDIRDKNQQDIWLDDCFQCERLEQVGGKSFRQSMIEKFGEQSNVSGPQRIDLLFDRTCNLACMTCSPRSSTFWAKHMNDHGQKVKIYDDRENLDKIIKVLSNLDLSNLGMIQFSGGETLLGNTYWRALQAIRDLVPDPSKIEVGFQTNCTQTVDEKWFDLIAEFQLVKLMMSIDGVGRRFEYLRWPADWNQTVDNIFNLRQILPSNVMFYIQECVSNLNIYHYGEVKNWIEQNFNANREGDTVDHSTQLAFHPYLSVDTITDEYFQCLQNKGLANLVNKDWKENPAKIKYFLSQVSKLDQWRDHDWKKVFPEVAEFYHRYL